MMEDFCYSLEDQKKVDKLLSAIRGKGAFKRFKDMVMKIGVREAWFAYREDQYKEIAIAFCEENGLDYTE